MIHAFVLLLAITAIGAQRLKITNGCQHEALWVAHMAQVKSGPDKQNIKLSPGESQVFHTPDGLSGTRYWAKMRCDAHGDRCEIGESGGPGQTCNETLGCAPPVDTKFEASFGAGGVDWVDVSLVDGWTLPFKFHMSKKCSAGDGDRKVHKTVDCSDLSLDDCPGVEHVGNASNGPLDLRVRIPGSATVVGCYAPCSKLTYTNWKNAAAKYGPADPSAREYCCPTPPESPRACRAGPVKTTKFVKAVHKKCPGVYGYSYDDGMGLLLCPDDTKYQMTFFCPHGEGSTVGRQNTRTHGLNGTVHGQNATVHRQTATAHGQNAEDEEDSGESGSDFTPWHFPRLPISLPWPWPSSDSSVALSVLGKHDHEGGKGHSRNENEGQHEHRHHHDDHSSHEDIINFADAQQQAQLPARTVSAVLPPWAAAAIIGAALLVAGAIVLKVRAISARRVRTRRVSPEVQQDSEGEENLLG
mmetsp:Transcript_98714/g.247365  ORF Transcript_98714/g.247365 Transcript_98714/m.247365 type:complete len:470 (+) Transcript_98714:75-1484(+)